MLLPAGDNVSPPPYCPSSYFVRNPKSKKCYTDRTSQTYQGYYSCPSICTAWAARVPDLRDPAVGTFLEENFPGYTKYPNQSYASRCFCERDASYLYFPDPAPGMEKPGDVYPPIPPPFSCPAHYAMDPDTAQCTRDNSLPIDPTDPSDDPPPSGPTDPADPTDPTTSPAGPTDPEDVITHSSREVIFGIPVMRVMIGAMVLVIIVVVLLFIAVVILYTRRSNMNTSGYQRVQQTIPMLPLRQPRRSTQKFQATVQATVYNPAAIV